MGEISKESSRWLRDVSSRYHNNILQTQRPSGILAVMAITIGITYFLRRRFLPHSMRGCRGLTAAGGTSGTNPIPPISFHWNRASWCDLAVFLAVFFFSHQAASDGGRTTKEKRRDDGVQSEHEEKPR